MPRPSNPTTGSLVWLLATRWRTLADRAVSEWGLTHATYSALACLDALQSGGARPNQRQLAQYAGLDPVYASKLVRILERGGLLVRVPDPSDARSVLLAMTDDGRAICTQAKERMRRLDRELTSSLGGPRSESVTTLNETLRALLAHADSTTRP